MCGSEPEVSMRLAFFDLILDFSENPNISIIFLIYINVQFKACSIRHEITKLLNVLEGSYIWWSFTLAVFPLFHEFHEHSVNS